MVISSAYETSDPAAEPRDLLPRPPLVEELVRRQAAEGGRVVGLDGVLPANLAARYGLPDLRAYDPLRPRPYVRLMQAFGDTDPVLGGPIRNAPPGSRATSRRATSMPSILRTSALRCWTKV